jgi:uncharacterized membrane protein (DUF2068 family)
MEQTEVNHQQPSTRDADRERRERRELGVVRTVAAYKIVKAVVMLMVGSLVMGLVHHNAAETVAHWLRRLNLDPSHLIVRRALAHLAHVNDAKLRWTGLTAYAYMVLYLVEGVGLWMDRRWAEWLTVIAGLLLVPFEVFELIRHPRGTLALVLIGNLLIVAFMYHRVREKTAKHARPTSAEGDQGPSKVHAPETT